MKEKLDQLFENTVKSSMIHECIMHVESGDGSFSWSRGYGGRTTETIINLASITKLFTTTCIINLMEQGKLSLDDKISKYFDEALMENLHIYKATITVTALQSGICCFKIQDSRMCMRWKAIV